MTRFIQTNGYSQKQFAQQLGWTESALSLVLSGKRRLTKVMAEDLESVMEREAGELLKVQADFEEWQEREQRLSTSRFGRLVDRDIRKAVQEGELGIDPFDPENVRPAKYDLTVGTIHWISPGRPVKPKAFYLRPHEVVRVDALESLNVPIFMTARVGGISSLIREGVVCHCGPQWDPGWNGHPFVVLQHLGTEELPLCRGDIFATVEFEFLARFPSESWRGLRNEDRRPEAQTGGNRNGRGTSSAGNPAAGNSEDE